MTPIPKAEERGEVLVEVSGMRTWQRELHNWPHSPLLDCRPDGFFFPLREVEKHPPHRHSEEAKYSFIMEGGRVMDPWTEMSKAEIDVERNTRKPVEYRVSRMSTLHDDFMTVPYNIQHNIAYFVPGKHF